MANGHKNLTLSRASVNVWDQPGWMSSLKTLDRERVICGASGALLAIYGMRRGGWLGRALTAAGAGIVGRAVSGRHDLTRARLAAARILDGIGLTTDESQDRVLNASDESFPASDSPSWTPTSGVKTRDERSRRREG
jgi:hypothetical protein